MSSRSTFLSRFPIFALLVMTFSLLVLAPVGVNWLRGCHSVWDLGIFAQALQQIRISELNPLLSTGRGTRIFNDHFDPILILLSPTGKWGDPSLVALVIEWIFLIATAATLHFFSTDRQKPESSSTYPAAIFLFSVATFAAATYPVHPATWSVFPLALLFLFFAQNRIGLSVITAASLILFKEEYIYILGFMGTSLLGLSLIRRNSFYTKTSIAFLSVSAASWALVFHWGPALFGGVHNYTSDFLLPWKQSPITTLLDRLWGSSWSLDLLLTLAPILPFWALQLIHRRPPKTLPTLAFLALLGIRFVTGKHGFHYQIPLLVCGIGMTDFFPDLTSAPATRRTRRFLITVSFLLLVPLFPKIGKYTVKTLFLGGTRSCQSSPTRVEDLREILSHLVANKGTLPLRVQGRLLPRFISRAPKGDIYPLDGDLQLQPSFSEFWLISEHPSLPSASFWPLSHEEGKQRLSEITRDFHLLEDRSTPDFLFQRWGSVP